MIETDLDEDELALYSLFMDESGIDQMELTWFDGSTDDGCFRTWPVQFWWWRIKDPFVISAGSRSVGKSLGCVARSYAFPFVYAGEEMVITAPDGDRLTALTDKIETVFMSNWVANAMLPRGQRGNIKHRPFHINFANTSRIMGRIPRHDGTGMQGSKKAGSLVLTRDRGLVEIENVTTNDYVWTHNQRWRPVIYTYELPEQAAFDVRGQGAIPLTVNNDHRFYVRNDVSKQPGKTKRKLGEFRWEYVNDLSSSQYGGINAYWTSPTNFGEELDIEYPNYSGCKTSYEMNQDFWWIVGRYLADGSIHGTSQMSITAPEKKEEELIKRFDSLEIKFNKRLKESGAFTYSFNNAGLARWLEEYFNRHSHHKTMPTWVFTMKREYRQALLDGYLSGDGCAFYHGTQNRYTGSSVSKKLALSIGTLAHTLGYHVGYGYNQPDVTEICGMELKEKPALRYLWRINEKGDGYVDNQEVINYKIRSVQQVEDCKFYGVVVEEDHSYFADGVIHHNTHPIILIQDEACFAGDTMVLTEKGYVSIKDINIGDRVLTHKNRWQKVTNVFNHGIKETLKIKGQGNHGLVVTPNHHFWTQKVLKWKDAKNRWGIKQRSDFDWVSAEEIDLWASPVNIPEVDKPEAINLVDIYDHNFLWCLGLYLAEGSTSSSYGTGGKLTKTTWSINVNEVDEVTNRLKKAGLHCFVQPVQNTQNCMNVVVSSIELSDWISRQCGKGAHSKHLPLWVLNLDYDSRKSVFDGLIYGDGNLNADSRYAEGACNYTTASKALAYDVKTLAQSLDLSTSVLYREGGPIEIRGVEYQAGPSYQVRIGGNEGQGYYEDNVKLTRIKSIQLHEPVEVWDIEVEEDHSYIVEGIIVHNSTYPERGWKEVIETVEIGKTGGRWLSYGVTMGPGNTFDDIINGKDPDWTVVKLPAMYRPTWSDEERQIKINKYGGYESLDYKRNILGTAVGADASLLSLTRLMGRNMDQDEMSDFNISEYYSIEVTDAMLVEVDDILDLIDPPITHTQYKKTWIGMDYGLTTSKSCILVFSEEKVNKESSERLKLVARIMMSRIPTKNQVEVIKHIMSIYRPIGFGFDAHGVGQPAYEWLQEEVRRDHDLSWMIDRMKGYSFSENIVWDLDDKIEYDPNIKDDWKRAALVRKTSDYSLDILRLVVDTDKLWLPYDDDVIGELRAVPRKDLMTMDEYGKPKRKQGGHILDAFRFALLSWKQQPVEQIVHKLEEDTYELPGLMMLDFA